MAEDKVYKFLNPVGIQTPVDTFALAPRLDSLDGKEIVFSITGEPDITIALEKKLKMDYPQVDWRIKKNYNIEPNRLSEEEMKTADGLIQAVCW
jgi:acyl carrier protein